VTELDNVVSGAKDVDLASLEEIARKIALFEKKLSTTVYPRRISED
jgi:uncharacterized linocin/CFP29 family protein